MEDEELKEYRKKLETAINQALTESPQINAAIQDIRDVGYEIFLIIEATIGFNRREESSSTPKQLPTVHLKLTTQDEKFLRSLKISPE
ncbi:hypothetical protein MYX84_07735 [Acidobacteria bacterium AH-259-O06]|nr:hypothetical protein [Acidobacteria bacterium AH-259-O06]